MKTACLKKNDLKPKWVLIDATDLILGRMSVEICKILRGKNKATFTPHMECGDKVIVLNCDKIAVSGKKMDIEKGKIYHRHTGYPGGLKTTTLKKILDGKNPKQAITLAVKRMLPKNKLGKNLLANLKVYTSNNHPHTSQQPEILDLATFNLKNKKRHYDA